MLFLMRGILVRFVVRLRLSCLRLRPVFGIFFVQTVASIYIFHQEHWQVLIPGLLHIMRNPLLRVLLAVKLLIIRVLCMVTAALK